MSCRRCVSLKPLTNSNSSTERSRTIICSDLIASSSTGCQSCNLLRYGVLAVLGHEDYISIEIDQFVLRKDGENRHVYPLTVYVVVGSEQKIPVDFYTDRVAIHQQWPLLPLSPHVSTDSSSTECLQLAREWLQGCLLSHDDCYPAMACRSSIVELPTRVIAVGDETNLPYLHETMPGEKGMYCALSYCWGLTRTFTTTEETLAARKQGFDLLDLPKTCRDAVVVARALKIPYLWIDSLCIIQDSTEDWETEAAKMCNVYTNATVTLAGLDSPNSDTGLFVADPTRQTTYLPAVTSGGESGYVYARKHYDRLLMGFLHAHGAGQPGQDYGGVLQTRGWVLQELTLSPRILWFSAWELGWSCRSETACECDPIPTTQLMERSASRLTTLPKKGEPVDWLVMWRDFVQTFTQRKLTHQSDQLPALTGIATAIQERIESEYFAGLWRKDLGKNLLWAVHVPSDDQGDGASHSVSLPEGYAPTWSWASTSQPIWFLNMTLRPSYLEVWELQRVDFAPSTRNPYGPGHGSITIESIVVELKVSDDGYFVVKVEENYIYFSETWSWYADQFGTANIETLSMKELYFIFAGILMKQSAKGEEPTSFVGLIVQKSADAQYHRLGLIETEFSCDSCHGLWSDWKARGSTQSIVIL